uniref:Hypothetical v-GCR n=1 Tax=Porcine lymphotropic herpesvirus 3 TaxID=199308 RepID=Q8B412_9GAMA|nr:hypothetical v-GCR [Porcine lymphotropic herpesvirus 3]
MLLKFLCFALHREAWSHFPGLLTASLEDPVAANMDILLNSTLEWGHVTGNETNATCRAVYNATVFWIGNTVQFLVLLASLFFLWLFACRARFKPQSNLWLSVYVLAYLFAIVSRLIQDFSTWPWKCTLTECMLLFSMLLTSAIVVGMTFDRCVTLWRGSKGGMTVVQILVFVAVSTLFCLLAVVANLISFGENYAALGFDGNESFKCRQATSVDSLKNKYVLKAVYFSLCMLIVLVATFLTVCKILHTKLKRKTEIVVNLIIVNLLICFTWLVMIISSLVQAVTLVDTCPSAFATGIGAYLMQLTVLGILLMFLFASQHLRKVLRQTVVIWWSSSSSS